MILKVNFLLWLGCYRRGVRSSPPVSYPKVWNTAMKMSERYSLNSKPFIPHLLSNLYQFDVILKTFWSHCKRRWWTCQDDHFKGLVDFLLWTWRELLPIHAWVAQNWTSSHVQEFKPILHLLPKEHALYQLLYSYDTEHHFLFTLREDRRAFDRKQQWLKVEPFSLPQAYRIQPSYSMCVFLLNIIRMFLNSATTDITFCLSNMHWCSTSPYFFTCTPCNVLWKIYTLQMSRFRILLICLEQYFKFSTGSGSRCFLSLWLLTKIKSIIIFKVPIKQ